MGQTLREVRIALLEADVALPVAKEFIEQVKARASGQEVQKSLTPGQALIKIVQEELTRLMGQHNDSLDLTVRPPAVILLAGLQGAGKTTTVAKLARYLVTDSRKRVMVVSADTYRPAAIDQLESLAGQVGAVFYPSTKDEKPLSIVKNALENAARQSMDVLVIDTAGRLHIDDEMMSEIKAIHKAANPVETLFVVDSMTGQDAVNTARAFDQALPLTGVILTKTDGDARGGAALSIRQVTGKPIKFIGTGEKINALEPFHPDRIASRILGMGDVLSLIEEVEQSVDHAEARRLAKKLEKGRGFNLEDFRDQMIQMQTMGGVSSIMDKLPGMGKMADAAQAQLNDSKTQRVIAIINSMTPQERNFPDIIKAARKRRIAGGSGTQVQDVNQLLKQFMQIQKMMKKMSKGGMSKMMRAMKGRIPGL